MKILYRPVREEDFSEMSDVCVGLLGSHNVCSHTCTPAKSLPYFCIWVGGVAFHFFFLDTSLPFNIHLHIPFHAVKSCGLVKAVVPQQIREAFVVVVSQKCRNWALNVVFTKWTQATSFMVTHCILTVSFRICKTSGPMLESWGTFG